MAALPAETSAAAPESGGQEVIDKVKLSTGSDFLDGFNKLDIVRQVGLLMGLAASIALGFAVVLWTQSEDYQPLFPNMEGYDLSMVIETMDGKGIHYKIEPKSGVLLVPSDEVSAVRLELAASGITQNDGVGYELLDQEQGIGTSQFMENTRYLRGLEGELARTISALQTVQSARVHLAIPKSSVFVRNSRKPSASVFLNMFSGRRLTQDQVNAIVNLVASSIPELKTEDVTVVDQKGRLLSESDEDSSLVMAGKQYEYTRKVEELLTERIGRILQPLVGSGGYKAEVTADVDFTQSEQTSELYNPENSAVRSEQTMEEQRVGAMIEGGIPGALSNQPPAAGQAPEIANGNINDGADSASGNRRQQSTRNFELDRTISYTQNSVGSVKRLSVAVVVDDRLSPEGDGSRVAWEDAELDRINALVKDAVGFDENRGDSVNILNQRFIQEGEIEFEGIPIWEQDWVLTLVKQLLGAAFLIVLVMGVMRPVLKNLATVTISGDDLAGSAGGMDFANLNFEEDDISDEAVALSSGEDILLPGPNQGYEKQIYAIKGMVAEEPHRVAQVIQQWINKDD